jgi:uncharacterized protein YidB (DUF937 family)
MQDEPHGQSRARESGGGEGAGKMSPLMMALLGLLAYKAIKSGGLGNILGGGQPSSPVERGRTPSLPPSGSARARDTGSGGLDDLLGSLLSGASGGGRKGGGGLTDLIPGGLGGLLAGGAGGSVLSSGLDGLIRDFQNSGHARAAQSWVSSGPNEDIAPHDLEAALGADTIEALGRETGMQHDDLLAELSRQLPRFVDRLTPQGRLPSEDEAARMI